MQDGAPYRSACTTLALAEKQSARSAVPWLSRSPDQTFVMWSSVWRSGHRGPRNVRQLQRSVVEEWDRIAQPTSEVHGFHAQSLAGRHSSQWRSYYKSQGILAVILMIKFRILILMQLNGMEVVLLQ